MFGEYSDRPGHSGNRKWTNEQLYGVVKEARKAGFQVSIRYIGSDVLVELVNSYRGLYTAGAGMDRDGTPNGESRSIHAPGRGL